MVIYPKFEFLELIGDSRYFPTLAFKILYSYRKERQFGQNRCPRMLKVHFRLTCVAQIRPCFGTGHYFLTVAGAGEGGGLENFEIKYLQRL